MRICYLHVDYEEWTDGHYNVQEIGLAKAFEALGHEVVIIYWVKSSAAKCNTKVRVTDHICKVYLPGKHIKHHVVFDCNLLKSYQFDLIHIQSDNLFYVPEVTHWCQRNKIPYYCYVGVIESSNSNKWQRIIVDYITKRNIKAFSKSRTLVKTPAVKAQLETLGVSKVEVAPVGLDFSIIPEITANQNELRKRLGLSLDKKLVVCVCALRPSKHPLDIFEFAKKLDDSVQIAFIGNGELLSEFQKRYNKKDFLCEIKHILYVPNKDIHQYYRCADFFVNFNTEEIFGMAILEAMYQECTVVARHAPGPDFIIEDRQSGYLAKTIDEMGRIVMKEKKLGKAARERVIRDFSWMSMAKIVLEEIGTK